MVKHTNRQTDRQEDRQVVRQTDTVHKPGDKKRNKAELLEGWLALSSVKYHDNLLVLMRF